MLDQLLEGIGAMSKVDARKARSRSGNYQDSTVAPVDRESDNKAVQQEDEEECEGESEKDHEDEEEDASGIIFAVTKVCFLFFLV
jgi:hypothetical protein